MTVQRRETGKSEGKGIVLHVKSDSMLANRGGGKDPGVAQRKEKSSSYGTTVRTWRGSRRPTKKRRSIITEGGQAAKASPLLGGFTGDLKKRDDGQACSLVGVLWGEFGKDKVSTKSGVGRASTQSYRATCIETRSRP